MPRNLLLCSLAGLLASALGVRAQPADLPLAPATTATYPPGVRVIRTAEGAVYASSRGKILYGMDMRTVLRAGPDPSKACDAACAGTWEPLAAPAGSTPDIRFPMNNNEGRQASPPGSPKVSGQPDVPDWTIIAGAQGPQWVYKGWHMVFTRRGADARSTAFDGTDNRTWNTLKFVPPVPRIVAPQNVKTAFRGGQYVLVDADGRTLFTGNCRNRRCDDWAPFAAGMASGGLGEWAVRSDGDTAQWTYRGRPVFVSLDDDRLHVPDSGTPLRP